MMPVQCEICGKYFSQITPMHLRVHDITMADYREKYGVVVESDLVNRARALFGGKELMENALMELPEETKAAIIADMETKVFNEEVRTNTLVELYSMLQGRSVLYRKAVELCSLLQDRAKDMIARGEDEYGKPISPKDIQYLMRAAEDSMRNSVESMVRLVSTMTNEGLAIAHSNKPGIGGTPAFTGEYDVVPMIRQTDGSTREKMRLLMESLADMPPEAFSRLKLQEVGDEKGKSDPGEDSRGVPEGI